VFASGIWVSGSGPPNWLIWMPGLDAAADAGCWRARYAATGCKSVFLPPLRQGFAQNTAGEKSCQGVRLASRVTSAIRFIVQAIWICWRN